MWLKLLFGSVHALLREHRGGGSILPCDLGRFLSLYFFQEAEVSYESSDHGLVNESLLSEELVSSGTTSGILSWMLWPKPYDNWSNQSLEHIYYIYANAISGVLQTNHMQSILDLDLLTYNQVQIQLK